MKRKNGKSLPEERARDGACSVRSLKGTRLSFPLSEKWLKFLKCAVFFIFFFPRVCVSQDIARLDKLLPQRAFWQSAKGIKGFLLYRSWTGRSGQKRIKPVSVASSPVHYLASLLANGWTWWWEIWTSSSHASTTTGDGSATTKWFDASEQRPRLEIRW